MKLTRTGRRETKDGNNSHSVGLADAARMWPTPRAHESGLYQYDQGDHSKPRPTLSGAVKKWPTPTVDDANQGEGGRLSGQYQSLTRAAMLPTPTARDKYSRGKQETTRHSPSLGNTVGADDHPGSLNPDWVEWVMNWPIGWSSLAPLPKENFEAWLGNSCWWQNEPDVPRVKLVTNKKIRVARLQAIGNGMVPLCVAAVWRLLTAHS